MTISRFTRSNIDSFPGKMLQLVRATDATLRSTTSTSFTDASLSVTITPLKNDSAILLIHFARAMPNNGEGLGIQITDNSNNVIVGDGFWGSSANSFSSGAFSIGRATPQTTSATTYKVRFRSAGGASVSLRNDLLTAQLYAIEVGA
jgi:hypothetical protein